MSINPIAIEKLQIKKPCKTPNKYPLSGIKINPKGSKKHIERE